MAKKNPNKSTPRATAQSAAIAQSTKAAEEKKAADLKAATIALGGRIKERDTERYGLLGRGRTINGVPHRLREINHLQQGPIKAYVPESDITIKGHTISVDPRNAVTASGKRLYGRPGPEGVVTAAGTVAPARPRSAGKSRSFAEVAGSDRRPTSAESMAQPLFSDLQKQESTAKPGTPRLAGFGTVGDGKAPRLEHVVDLYKKKGFKSEGDIAAIGSVPSVGSGLDEGYLSRVKASAETKAKQAAATAASTSASSARGVAAAEALKKRDDYTAPPSDAQKAIGEWLRKKRQGVVLSTTPKKDKDGNDIPTELNAPVHKRDVKTTRDEVIHPGDPSRGIDPIVVPKGAIIAKAGEYKLPRVDKTGNVKNLAKPEVGFSRQALIDSAVESVRMAPGPRMESGSFHSKFNTDEAINNAMSVRNSRQFGNFVAPNPRSLRELNEKIHPLQVPTSGPKDPHTGRPILEGALEMPSGNPRFNKANVSKAPTVTKDPGVSPIHDAEHVPYAAESDTGPLSTDVNERAETVNPYLERMRQGAFQAPESMTKGPEASHPSFTAKD